MENKIKYKGAVSQWPNSGGQGEPSKDVPTSSPPERRKLVQVMRKSPGKNQSQTELRCFKHNCGGWGKSAGSMIKVRQKENLIIYLSIICLPKWWAMTWMDPTSDLRQTVYFCSLFLLIFTQLIWQVAYLSIFILRVYILILRSTIQKVPLTQSSSGSLKFNL